MDLAEISTASSDSNRLKKGFLGVKVTLKAGSTGITNKHEHRQLLLPRTWINVRTFSGAYRTSSPQTGSWTCSASSGQTLRPRSTFLHCQTHTVLSKPDYKVSMSKISSWYTAQALITQLRPFDTLKKILTSQFQRVGRCRHICLWKL